MAKTQNYSPEAVKTLISVYQAAGDLPEDEPARIAAIENLAEQFGKTIASIRSKLSFEGVYIKKEKPEPKRTRVSKNDLVSQIAETADLENDSFFDSLEGANKAVLEWIIDLQNSVDAS